MAWHLLQAFLHHYAKTRTKSSPIEIISLHILLNIRKPKCVVYDNYAHFSQVYVDRVLVVPSDFAQNINNGKLNFEAVAEMKKWVHQDE